jgi:hypothetical protein
MASGFLPDDDEVLIEEKMGAVGAGYSLSLLETTLINPRKNPLGNPGGMVE